VRIQLIPLWGSRRSQIAEAVFAWGRSSGVATAESRGQAGGHQRIQGTSGGNLGEGRTQATGFFQWFGVFENKVKVNLSSHGFFLSRLLEI